MASEEDEFQIFSASPQRWRAASDSRGEETLQEEGRGLCLSDLQREAHASKIENIRRQLAMSHVAVVGKKVGRSSSSRPTGDGMVDLIKRRSEGEDESERSRATMTRSLMETRPSKSAEVMRHLLSSLAEKERLWGEELMRGSKLEAENAELRAKVEALQEKTSHLQQRMQSDHEFYNKSIDEMNAKVARKDEELLQLHSLNLSLVDKLSWSKTKIRQLTQRNRLLQKFSAADSTRRKRHERSVGQSTEEESFEESDTDMAEDNVDRRSYNKKLQELYALKALRRAIEMERENQQTTISANKDAAGKLFSSKTAASQLSLYERLLQSRMRESRGHKQSHEDHQDPSHAHGPKLEGEERQAEERQDED